MDYPFADVILEPAMNESDNSNFEMVFDKDVVIPMSDGTILRANLCRPDADGPFPVIMAKGATAKMSIFATGTVRNGSA